ncbi:MAG: hypothetical protein AMJ65_08195 [Phycisphaerae bacterium SG8_4]|nr:MAG: hypothetical protein AMJ65_08195 [Phycisphaerae bacterium SG8_4]
METVQQTLTALRPREAKDLQVAMEAFKADIKEGEGRLDVPVETKTDFEVNSALALRLSKANKEIEKIRKKANEEHHNSIKHNNGLVKPITDQVNNLVRAIRSQNDVYLREQQRIQREEEEKARRIEEGRRKAQETRAAQGMKVKPVEDLAPVARPVDFKKTTAVQIKKVWQWKIVDYAKVPESMKKENWQRDSIDGRAVISAGKDGIEIPGIEVWAEDRSY